MAIFCFSYNGSLRALSGTSVTLSIIFFFATSLCIGLFLDYETYSGTFSPVHELFASS
jgi:hypothetical protein